MAEHADKPDVAHLEHRSGSVESDRIEHVHHEHRDTDDRGEEANLRSDTGYPSITSVLCSQLVLRSWAVSEVRD
jgi:hypothetical protein